MFHAGHRGNRESFICDTAENVLYNINVTLGRLYNV